MSDNSITEQHRHFQDVFLGHRSKAGAGSLGRPVQTREPVLLGDDEGDGRFAGLLRQQQRQLGHSAMTCLEQTTLCLPPALPKDLRGMQHPQTHTMT